MFTIPLLSLCDTVQRGVPTQMDVGAAEIPVLKRERGERISNYHRGTRIFVGHGALGWDWRVQGKEASAVSAGANWIFSPSWFYSYKKSKPPLFPVCDPNLASSAAEELQLFPKAESK